jgi:PIF1-like helicase
VIYNAVDFALKDIRKHLPGGDYAFGGIPRILGGDFQQILPIVPHGNRASNLKLTHLQLRQDMRLSTTTWANGTFGAWLDTDVQ